MISFTEKDLTLNKEGKLSSSQFDGLKIELEKGVKMGDKIMKVIMFLFLVAAIAAPFQSKPLMNNIIYYIPIVIVVLIAYYYGFGSYLRYKSKKFASSEFIPVKMVSGVVELSSVNYNNGEMTQVQKFIEEDITTNYIVKIAEKTFYTDRNVISNMKDKDNYKIYYVNLGVMPFIVSWEKI